MSLGDASYATLLGSKCQGLGNRIRHLPYRLHNRDVRYGTFGVQITPPNSSHLTVRAMNDGPVRDRAGVSAIPALLSTVARRNT